MKAALAPQTAMRRILPIGDGEISTGLLRRVHTQQRALERYGTELTDDDYDEMCAQCQEDRGVCLGRKPGRKKMKVWIVWWPSARRVVPVYYCKGTVASVLPRQNPVYGAESDG